jgi:uncharacterized damage-inducible protein DinB
MKSFFRDLFEYSHHFNQELAVIFSESPDKPSEKAVQLFNHLLNAHQIWNNRIEPKQLPFGVWQLNPTQEFENINSANYEQTLYILDNFDLNTTVGYTNSKGDTFSNNIRDIYFHVINHSTYHRAQIATEFRQYGLNPLVSDYIFYKRTSL